MARTRAAGDNAAGDNAAGDNAARNNGAYRADGTARVTSRAASRAPAGSTRRGQQPTPAGGSRHALGVFAVVAVFALVGVTLWRPLAILVALPVIVVLALVVRSGVPVPAPRRAGATGATGARARQARGTAAGPANDAALPAARSRPGRYDDRPPYDQEADRPDLPAQPRRPGPPTPADRRRPAGRHDAAGAGEPGEAPARLRADEPARPARRRAARPQAGEPAAARNAWRGGPDARSYDDASYANEDPRARRRTDEPRGTFTPRSRDEQDAPSRRRGGPSAGYDRADAARPADRLPARPAGPGRGEDDRHRDDRYVGDGPRDGRWENDERRRHTPGEGARAADARYPGRPAHEDGPDQFERPRRHGDAYSDDYQDRRGLDEHDEHQDHQYPVDEYSEHEYPVDGYDQQEPGYQRRSGREQDGAAGDRRRRGWRHQAWEDEEGWDDTPEPEPNEDMMHTMSIDMRGYLDDTGSFRIG